MPLKKRKIHVYEKLGSYRYCWSMKRVNKHNLIIGLRKSFSVIAVKFFFWYIHIIFNPIRCINFFDIKSYPIYFKVEKNPKL